MSRSVKWIPAYHTSIHDSSENRSTTVCYRMLSITGTIGMNISGELRSSSDIDDINHSDIADAYNSVSR